MSGAKQQVFIEKVLKRLYPSVPNQQLHSTTETSSKPKLEPKNIQPSADDEKKSQPRKKMYTVSPPPDGYAPCSPEFTDSKKSENSDSTDDTEEENPQEPPKRRRRRKRKPKNMLQNPHNIHVEPTEFEKNESHLQEKLQPQHTDGPQISKNKKRKLKKKQQKERKRAAGLLTKATGISFTYQPESSSEAEDFTDTNEKADGILDFLQATQEIYFSDGNFKSGSTACLETIQEVFKHLEFHRIASSDIMLLDQMKTLVLLQDTERLKSALEQFQEQCLMPPDHAKEIASLFHYWITDILPMRNRK